MHRGKVYVVGVGMTKFEKPGKREDFDYPDMAHEAVTKALADAGVEYKDVEQAAVGYVYGDSTCGQRALYPLGMTGIPVRKESLYSIVCQHSFQGLQRQQQLRHRELRTVPRQAASGRRPLRLCSCSWI